MAEAIFKRLDAFPNLCSQIPLLKGQTLPLILPSSHPSRLAPAANIILPVEIKACFSGTLQSSRRDRIINQEKESAWWEVGEKGQQYLKPSDVPLIAEPGTKIALSSASLGATPFTSTLSLVLPLQLPDSMPSEPTPRYCASQSWVCPFYTFSDSFFILHQSLFWWYQGFLRQAVLAP